MRKKQSKTLTDLNEGKYRMSSLDRDKYSDISSLNFFHT